jgi:arabinan endo-1,5-alpha-L-arabinosidase
MVIKCSIKRAAFAAIGWLAVQFSSASASAQEGDIRGVHDPCIIKEQDSYYIFSTGGGIPVRTSKDLIHWESIGQVFDDVPAWTRQEVPGSKGLWAPDISFFNGRYHLYYSVSTFGKNRSCIGLATNQTLDPKSTGYKWIDQGKVIESEPGRDDWNAIDPNVVLDADRK